LYPHFQKIVQYAYSLGFSSIEIFTNGTNHNCLPKSLLIEKKVNLAISVYGQNRNVHESVTQVKGSFNKTIETVKWAVKNDVNLRVAVIIMSHNEKFVDSTIDYLQSINVQHIQIDNVRNVGRAKQLFKDSAFENNCVAYPSNGLCISASGNISNCIFQR